MRNMTFLTMITLSAASIQSLTGLEHNPYASESFSSKKSKDPFAGHFDDRDKDRGRDRNNVQGPKGPKGDKGDKGDPGTSYTLVYGFYTQQGQTVVDPGAGLVFNTEGRHFGGLKTDLETGAFKVPEGGDYQITYMIQVNGESQANFGVFVNEKLLSGSVTNTNSSGQLTNTCIASLAKGDKVQVVNLADSAFALDAGDALSQHNASIFINKLN